jgi:hypothetical protein
MKIPTIHRRDIESGFAGRWFVYNGEAYSCVRMGPYGSGDDCWDVYREIDTALVGQFCRLDDIRALLQEAIKQGWPDLIELPDPYLADFTK